MNQPNSHYTPEVTAEARKLKAEIERRDSVQKTYYDVEARAQSAEDECKKLRALLKEAGKHLRLYIDCGNLTYDTHEAWQKRDNFLKEIGEAANG